MHSIEQAREALRRIAEGNLGDAPWQANYARIKQVAAEALAALSRPVEGVKGEPNDDAARIVYSVMSWVSGLPGPSGETIPAWDDPAAAIFRDKARDAARDVAALDALANPEAEARLRERVAGLEKDVRFWKGQFEDQVDSLPAAEARLAQAEGGPAVTEAIRAILDDDDADVYEKLGDIRAALSRSTREGKTE